MKRLVTVAMLTVATVTAVATANPAGAHEAPDARTTYAVQSQTPAGTTPHFPALDAATNRVLVSNVAAGAVTELAVGTGPTRTFAPDPPASGSHTVVVDPDGRRAFVTNKGSATVSVIDLITDTVSAFKVGPNPHGLAIDGRYGRLYVTSIDADRLEVYDLATLAPITTVAVGDGPWGVTVGPGRVAVTDTAADTVHILDRETLTVREIVTVGAGPWNATFLGGTLYVTLERSGEVVAVRGSQVAWRTSVGASPHGISADPRRGLVFAAVTGSDAVAVVDARHGSLLQSIPVADAPAGMTIDRDGRVFVANQGAGVVTALAPVPR